VLVDRGMHEAVGEREVDVPVDVNAPKAKKVRVTVVNSLEQLRYVITKERLEGPESVWRQTEKENLVWLDPVRGQVEKRAGKRRVPRKQLKGRRIVDRGGEEAGLSMLV